MRRAGDIPNVSAAVGCEDFVLPRAASGRAHSAVLRADRRDVVLPQSVAAAGTGGRAVCRRVGLAIRCAGTGCGVRLRRAGDDHLQSGLRSTAGTLKALEAELFGQTANAPRQSGGTFWVSQRTEDGQAIINAVQPRPGHQPQWRLGIRLRYRGPVQAAHRSTRGSAGARRLAAARRSDPRSGVLPATQTE